jgi:hypothetical protein
MDYAHSEMKKRLENRPTDAQAYENRRKKNRELSLFYAKLADKYRKAAHKDDPATSEPEKYQ